VGYVTFGHVLLKGLWDIGVDGDKGFHFAGGADL
jgi:hypothetical protein